MIKQSHQWDCAHCCLAMFLDAPVMLIYERFPEQDGIPVSDAAKYLWKHGHDVSWFPARMPTRKAIVIVHSKTYPEKWHAIFHHLGQFYDPSSGGARYESAEDVRAHLVGTLE